MISKQNLWFLTLFSVILVLSVYYITMPNDLLKEVSEESVAIKDEEVVSNISSLVAMRVSLLEERQEEMDVLQEQLVNTDLSSTEKNNVYEKLKYLNELQGKEEELEKKIKNNLKLDCFVKVDNNDISCVCVSNKHNSSLANNVMRVIQEEYSNKVFISVKFQKK